MKTRCKLQCMFKQEGPGWDSDGKHYRGSIEVRFGAVYSQDPNSENKNFWESTPNASLQMYITNHAAADLFEIGKEYYLDFTPA